MRFFIRKRRQTPAVIIVALIDVLIVLLIFLMVTTTFKQQPHVFKLALPESSQARKTGVQENPPLVVIIDAKGALRLDGLADYHELPVTEERLKSELVALEAKNPKLTVAVSADKDAPWGQIVKVMDAVKESGLTTKTIQAYTKEAAKP